MIYGLPIWNWFVFFFVYIPIVILWVSALFDMIARPDIRGWGKVGWAILIFALPLLGALTYLGTRPAEEEAERQAYKRAA